MRVNGGALRTLFHHPIYEVGWWKNPESASLSVRLDLEGHKTYRTILVIGIRRRNIAQKALEISASRLLEDLKVEFMQDR